MPWIVQESVKTADSSIKTYTVEDLLRKLSPLCGHDQSAGWRADAVGWLNDAIGELMSGIKFGFQLARHQLSTLPTYQTGHVTLTRNSAVAGFGGGAALDSSFEGRKLVVDYTTAKTAVEISSVISPTQAELLVAWPGSDLTQVSFVIAQDEYTLPADFDVPRLIQQKFSNLNLFLSRDLPTSIAFSNVLTACRISADKKLIVHPFPNSQLVIEYEYYRAFQVLSDDESSFLQIPDKHMSGVLAGAAYQYWMGQGDKEALARAQVHRAVFLQARRDLLHEKYANITELVSIMPLEPVGVREAD